MKMKFDIIKTEKNKAIKNAKNFDEVLDIQY
jgi:hypothetical protein